MSNLGSNQIQESKMARLYEFNIYTEQDPSNQQSQTNCCTGYRDDNMPTNIVKNNDENVFRARSQIIFERIHLVNQWTKQEIRRCIKSLIQNNFLIPPSFTCLFAREQMSLSRLGRGKDSKHFPIILLKFFRTIYKRQFDDSSVETTSTKLGLNHSHIKALSRLLEKFSQKIASPRKILKQLEQSDSFLLLLLFPAMQWLKLSHQKIQDEQKQYEYRRYFSQVVYFICYKLEIMDDPYDFDDNDDEEEDQDENDFIDESKRDENIQNASLLIEEA